MHKNQVYQIVELYVNLVNEDDFSCSFVIATTNFVAWFKRDHFGRYTAGLYMAFNKYRQSLSSLIFYFN